MQNVPEDGSGKVTLPGHPQAITRILLGEMGLPLGSMTFLHCVFPSEAMPEQCRTGCRSEYVKAVPAASTVLDKRTASTGLIKCPFCTKGLHLRDRGRVADRKWEVLMAALNDFLIFNCLSYWKNLILEEIRAAVVHFLGSLSSGDQWWGTPAGLSTTTENLQQGWSLTNAQYYVTAAWPIEEWLSDTSTS